MRYVLAECARLEGSCQGMSEGLVTVNGKVEAERFCSWQVFPAVLVFQLKRFQKGKAKKNSTRVEFPESLELVSLTDEHHRYSLYAVIVHSGASVSAGHFVTFGRKQTRSEYLWYCFDDEDRTMVAGGLTAVLTKEPYMLFYAKV